MNHAQKEPSGRKLLAAAVASLLVPVGAGAAVGRIDFASGDVSGKDAQGKERRLTRGATINEGDTIVTGRGRAQIRFSDGARTALLPNSEFRVDTYRYEAQKEEESRGFFSLLKGGLRTITGAIGRTRRDGYRVTTPTATIGIRGTEYLAVLGNSLSVWVGGGEIEACNRGGCETFEGGESGYVADEDSKPIHTDQKPDTSSGEIGNDSYSAAEDVSGDGTSSAFEPPQDAPEETPPGPLFADGAFYVLAVARGDGFESSTFTALEGTLQPPAELVDATFNGTAMVAYTHSDISGSLGTATVLEAGGDGIVGWARWTGGIANFDEPDGNGPFTLNEPVSHHYAIGLPTMDMPTLGQASYALIGGTSPTEVQAGGDVGTLNSASLNVDFETSKVEVAVDFSVGMNAYQIGSPAIAMGSGLDRFRFQAAGSFTEGVNCSSPCFTKLEGFFAGAAASRAGLTYLVDPDFGPKITGAAGFQSQGIGTGTPIIP